MHSQLYPFSHLRIFHPLPTLATAAAFEGMHHWEHLSRQSGDRIPRDDARSSLVDIVARDTVRLLENTASEMMDRYDMISNAAERALDLYDQQYGGNDWYDPGQMEAHETMKGEWKENED